MLGFMRYYLSVGSERRNRGRICEETAEFELPLEVRHIFQRAPEESPGHDTHTNTHFPNPLLWKGSSRDL
ncbi:hypothetical protein IRJ41_014224 [Triplophysa rosa]|uniref:Uncharacterized protein n=1 Tax=Triplophysa rosa TaxID=992332 RepID=A0A9W7WWD0_TRIRA|nr:hypothetical protein IRJ41_014224 [Triplophysa rosa]